MNTVATQPATQPLFERSIDVLACPYCGASLRYDGERIHCQGCKKSFNVDNDSEQTLMEKATRGVFARLLGEQIPQGALVLEVGCGTGQLTNFLGMHYNRRVFGSDMCLHSLRLAQEF